ncbi:MAG: type II toxin-antitoxin system YafQ family toxin [Parabacteroides sp.]|nr:type II toxin-antitoxin system YafQ family toxin [Parabacteroides sp.]
MKTIHYSTKAKKDLKKYRGNIKLMEALFDVLDKLKTGEAIPSKYKPHELIGNYKNCMECHVGNDFLLIWIDAVSDMVEIVRIGSHSELFGKKK